eukprot:6102333-Amphidinium_carterae.1
MLPPLRCNGGSGLHCGLLDVSGLCAISAPSCRTQLLFSQRLLGGQKPDLSSSASHLATQNATTKDQQTESMFPEESLCFPSAIEV